MTERKAGNSRLVYNKKTRTIDTVRTSDPALVEQMREEGGCEISAGGAATGDKPGINYEAWARNAVRFIRQRGMEQEFTDWCGGWPCPIETPKVYVTGTVEGFARRGLKRTT